MKKQEQLRMVFKVLLNELSQEVKQYINTKKIVDCYVEKLLKEVSIRTPLK